MKVHSKKSKLFIPHGGFYPACTRILLAPDPQNGNAGGAGGGGNGGAGTGNQNSNEDLAKAVAAALLPQVSAQIAVVKTELQDNFAKAIGELKPKPKEDGKDGKPTIETLTQQVSALTDGIKQRDDALASEKRFGAVRAAVSKIKFFDPEDAVRELGSKVQEKDGRYFVAGKEKVSGIEVDKQYSLEEAVGQLAKQKPHWVRAEVRDGSGANGGTSTGVIDPNIRKVTKDDFAKGNVDPADVLAGKVKVAS